MFNGLFIVTTVAVGGAETMLLRLLSGMDRSKIAASVIALQSGGPLGAQIRELGIPVYELGWGQGAPRPKMLQKLIQAIRRTRPDFVQGWMIHANLAAEIARWCWGPTMPVLWNVRHSLHESGLVGDSGVTPRSTSAALHILKHLSTWPRKIVYNSRTSAEQHERLGYDPRKTVVIPNGFDCRVFRPRPECRPRIRMSLGIAADAPLIGLIARAHPVKDHETFLQAARTLISSGSSAHFVLAGRGTNSQQMAARIAALDLQGRVHPLGERSDIPELAAALDVAVCSSKSEAFPNAIGEAMACGVPCVVTDVGDSQWIVGKTGRVVPVGHPAAIASAMGEFLGLGAEQQRALGDAARRRIQAEFSLDRVVSRYHTLYQEVTHSTLLERQSH